MIYNDAYSVFAGGRHPAAAGLEGAGGLAGGGRPQPPGHGGRPARGNAVIPRRAPHPLPPRPAARRLGRPRLQPPARRERQAGGRARDRGGDHRARARREGAARQRGAVPHLRRRHAEPRLGGNPDGKLDWFNDRWSSTPAQARRRCRAIAGARSCIPRTSASRSQAWQKALASGTVYEVEFRLRRKRRRLSLAPRPRHADPRRCRQGGALDRHQHRYRRQDPGRACLREREADLARVQQIGKVGGVEVFLDRGLPQPSLARIPRHSRPAAGSRPGDATRTGCAASIRRIARRPSASSSTR